MDEDPPSPFIHSLLAVDATTATTTTITITTTTTTTLLLLLPVADFPPASGRTSCKCLLSSTGTKIKRCTFYPNGIMMIIDNYTLFSIRKKESSWS